AGDEGIQDPAYLQKIEAFSVAYQKQPGVVHVNSVSDVFKKINRSMHQDKPEEYKLSANRQLATQYLMLYEFSLPQGFDLNNQINNTRSATRFVVTLENVTSRRTRELADWGEAWLKENTPPYMHAMAASPAVMFAHISQRNVNSMLFGSLWALLFISICLMFALKSFRYGLLSLIPNFLPAIFAFGIWGLTVSEIGLALSGVVSMTLGIVVDDTVHFLSKYIRARREQGLSAEDAVRYAFKSVGKALMVTSLVLTSGFMIMTMSNFTMNGDMGWLTSITIVVALIADLLFLPPILITFDKLMNRKEVRKNETVTA
ncbi:MAG: MMPL family transporter, partial [Lentisphaeraceae bacterium]|nr:MMPL family transporter [Lentisphaeraceae bacterium]